MVSLLSVLSPVTPPAAGFAPAAKGVGDPASPIDFAAFLAIAPGDAASTPSAIPAVAAGGAPSATDDGWRLLAEAPTDDARQPLAAIGIDLPPPSSDTAAFPLPLPAPSPPVISTKALLLTQLASSPPTQAALAVVGRQIESSTPALMGDDAAPPPGSPDVPVPASSILVSRPPRHPVAKAAPAAPSPRRAATDPALLSPLAIEPDDVEPDSVPTFTAEDDPDRLARESDAPSVSITPAPPTRADSPAMIGHSGQHLAPPSVGGAPTVRVAPDRTATSLAPVLEASTTGDPTPGSLVPSSHRANSTPNATRNLDPTTTPLTRDRIEAAAPLAEPKTAGLPGEPTPVTLPVAERLPTQPPREAVEPTFGHPYRRPAIDGDRVAGSDADPRLSSTAADVPVTLDGPDVATIPMDRRQLAEIETAAAPTPPKVWAASKPSAALTAPAAQTIDIAARADAATPSSLPSREPLAAGPSAGGPLGTSSVKQLRSRPDPLGAMLGGPVVSSSPLSARNPTSGIARVTTSAPATIQTSATPTTSVERQPSMAAPAPTAGTAQATPPVAPPLATPAPTSGTTAPAPVDRSPMPSSSPVTAMPIEFAKPPLDPAASPERTGVSPAPAADTPARESAATGNEPVRVEPAFRAFAAAMFDVASAASAVPAASATPRPDAAPLDLTQGRWPHAMVDRIERLRDEASLGDTRIRLIPDALGTIDVALRRDGESVHVAFHAERAETRQLLAEARPELTALAEARGIKLADPAPATGGGWTGGQAPQGQNFAGNDRAPGRQPQPSTPAAPPRAAHAADEPGDDTRIA